MNKIMKIITIISAVLLVGLGSYLLILKFSQKKAATDAPGSPAGVPTGFIIPPENAQKMNVKTKKSAGDTDTASLEVSNIYNNPVETLPGGVVDFRSTNDYLMEFQPTSEQFVISIQNSDDINGARTKAESAFLEALGINQEKACGLNVVLAIPVQVNEKNSGSNFGLSFCPDGKPFE